MTYLLNSGKHLSYECVRPLKPTLKQQLNGQKWDEELRYLPAFGWAMLFACPEFGTFKKN